MDTNIYNILLQQLRSLEPNIAILKTFKLNFVYPTCCVYGSNNNTSKENC